MKADEREELWLQIRSVLGSPPFPPLLDKIEELLKANTKACMAAVCEGCREGWPSERDLRKNWWHYPPHADRMEGPCDAQPIREMADD